jgi:nucleoside-diphosphate-sugar epimerase
MRIVVIGATGNVGLSLIEALRASPEVTELEGVARRLPGPSVLEQASCVPAVAWRTADIADDPLDFLQGADVVVHLAWQIQPSRDEAGMRRTNVDGTRRVVESMLAHGVPRLVYASSVGAYSPGPKDRLVDESWPVGGIRTSTYSRHKSEVEHYLDEVERRDPGLAIVRMRTSLVFQGRAASEVHRLFLGQLAPWHLPRPLRWIPQTPRLVFQVTAADDIADAYVRAVVSQSTGAFNIAADPPLTAPAIAEICDGRTLKVPQAVLRAAGAATYRLRLQPAEPGWLDMAFGTPLMDSTRAATELGWSPGATPSEALHELLSGMGEGAGADTQPLQARWATGTRGSERRRPAPSGPNATQV